MGSFANVVVLRVPERRSLLWPPSRCPKCEAPIAWYDNVPILSWLWLRGRCRRCRAPISPMYPLVEAAYAALWAGAIAYWGPGLVALKAIVFGSWLVALALIDLRTMLLPDLLTISGMFAGLLLSWAEGMGKDALVGAVAGYAAFALIGWSFQRLTGREGLGQGDWKLLAMIGAFLGWRALPIVVFLSSAVGAAVGGAWIWLRRKGKDTEIPYGPFLAAAAVVVFVWIYRR
ncbi:MAG: prepilin peptidase [Zetaproteobacteria bacterium]|nr:MAG: prepilin peptidase [Zetaproteobacteria bacterium]